MLVRVDTMYHKHHCLCANVFKPQTRMCAPHGKQQQNALACMPDTPQTTTSKYMCARITARARLCADTTNTNVCARAWHAWRLQVCQRTPSDYRKCVRTHACHVCAQACVNASAACSMHAPQLRFRVHTCVTQTNVTQMRPSCMHHPLNQHADVCLCMYELVTNTLA